MGGCCRARGSRKLQWHLYDGRINRTHTGITWRALMWAGYTPKAIAAPAPPKSPTRVRRRIPVSQLNAKRAAVVDPIVLRWQ